MLAHAVEEPDLAALDPADFMAEWKWDGIRVQASAGTGRARPAGRAALFAHRRGHLQKLSRSRRRAAPAGGHRRRTADLARGPRAVVQRPAAAAQSQSGHAQAAGGISRRICAPTTCLAEGERRPARPALRRAPAAAGEIRRQARRSAPRPFAAGRLQDLGRADRGARRSRQGRRGRRCRSGRRRHAQARATRPICRAGRRARGGNGSATR